MKYLKLFLSAVLAGVSIAIGGTVSLMVGGGVLGAALFTVGLFTVCCFGFHLFTGKVCYVFENDRSYALGLPVIWLGNLAGTYLTALLEGLTRHGPKLREAAAALCAAKLDDSLLSLFLLGLGCNILIFIAVDGYGKNPHQLGKYLSLFFGIMVFILCGFEHCVADMYYFSMGGVWSGAVLGRLLIITLGNCAGGVLLPLARRAVRGKGGGAEGKTAA